jgi:hypothetical protein
MNVKRVKYIYHNGRQILFLDFSGCTVEDFHVSIQEAEKLIRAEPPNSVLTLTDVTSAKYNLEVTKALKEFAIGNKPFVKAGAVVGLDALKKIIYNSIMHVSGRNLLAFDTIAQAKDWLVEEWKRRLNGPG